MQWQKKWKTLMKCSSEFRPKSRSYKDLWPPSSILTELPHQSVKPIIRDRLQAESKFQILIFLGLGEVRRLKPFRDSFIAAVYTNHTLSDVQKLSLLKACLHGEAEQVITHLLLCSGNYACGFKNLEDRYTKKRLILHSHLDAIFNIPYLHRESSDELKKLDENCLALEVMNFKVQLDYMRVHFVAEKLDPASRRQWELESSRLQQI